MPLFLNVFYWTVTEKSGVKFWFNFLKLLLPQKKMQKKEFLCLSLSVSVSLSLSLSLSLSHSHTPFLHLHFYFNRP